MPVALLFNLVREKSYVFYQSFKSQVRAPGSAADAVACVIPDRSIFKAAILKS